MITTDSGRKFTRQEFSDMLDTLDSYYEDKKKVDDSMESMFSILSDGCYSHFLTFSPDMGFLSAIKIVNEELEDWLSYYLYEAKNMDRPVVTDKDDNPYNFKVKEDVLDFLTKFYGKDN